MSIEEIRKQIDRVVDLGLDARSTARTATRRGESALYTKEQADEAHRADSEALVAFCGAANLLRYQIDDLYVDLTEEEVFA